MISINKKLSKKHPEIDDETLEVETQNYVSLPSTDSAQPSPHSTGGAIDVVIVKLDQVHEEKLLRLRFRLAGSNLDLAKRVGLEIRLSAIMRRHSKMLDFGTAFDHGSKKSALTYYEAKIADGEVLTEAEMLACNNRRLLFWTMAQAGLQPYFAEWWHFNAPESQMGAAAAGLNHATFGTASLDASNMMHENTRLNIHQKMLILQKEQPPAARQTALQTEILAALHETGDPTVAENWPAEIIAPC